MRKNLRLLSGKSSNVMWKICDLCFIITDNTLEINPSQNANHHQQQRRNDKFKISSTWKVTKRGSRKA